MPAKGHGAGKARRALRPPASAPCCTANAPVCPVAGPKGEPVGAAAGSCLPAADWRVARPGPKPTKGAGKGRSPRHLQHCAPDSNGGFCLPGVQGTHVPPRRAMLCQERRKCHLPHVPGPEKQQQTTHSVDSATACHLDHLSTVSPPQVSPGPSHKGGDTELQPGSSPWANALGVHLLRLLFRAHTHTHTYAHAYTHRNHNSNNSVK